MTSSARSAIALAGLGIAACLSACEKHPERTVEGTLGLLRAALANPNGSFDRVADTRLIAEATALVRARQVQEHIGIPLTDSGLDRALADVGATLEPRHYFAGVLPMLRSGHCERIGDDPLPDVISHLPEPQTGWPPRMLALQINVARRAEGAVSGDYRCDGGPSFGAVFSHPYPSDGTWRVALVGPSRHP